MYTSESIFQFLNKYSNGKPLHLETDIVNSLDIYGDDIDELLADFANTFKVDMSQYLWYFHTEEEGQNLGGLFFKSPNRRVRRIPITPQMLLEFANTGKWNVNYPIHKLPKYRIDLLINFILFIVVIWLIVYYWLIK